MTPAQQARGVGVGNILSHHARLHPQQLAVADDEQRIDFGTLDRNTNRLANALMKAGTDAGDRVAVRLPNGHRYLESLFACAKIGAVMVPVDRALVTDEVEHVLRDSGAGVLLDGPEGYDAFTAGSPDTEPARQPAPHGDDPLLLMYTSGTTGRPKGVVLTHGNALFTSFNQLLGWHLTNEDRALVVAPFHHVGGLLVMGFPCLHTGGATHIAKPDPEAVLETIEREQITALFLSPMLWRRIAALDALDSAKLDSVRLCASGGDPIPTEPLARLNAAFKAEFTDAYGLTEAASCSTILPGDAAGRKPGSAGLPCTHVDLRILRADGTESEPGEIGAVVQAGPTVMRGYWQRPEDTAAALRDGWLHTGDLGTVDEEGFLFIAGREKDLIVSGGAKVYAAEVERVLREHTGVGEVAVIGVPDDQLGERVAAVVVSRPGLRLEPGELLEFCEGRIADYKRPHAVHLVDTLPRNANGKILKAELRSTYATTR